jgi:hypothetical protein
VAEWVTCHAEVNDLVNLRVGGSFTYATDNASVKAITVKKNTTTEQSLLFVAGGLGIIPLFSMIQQRHVDQRVTGSIYGPPEMPEGFQRLRFPSRTIK